MPLKKRSVTIVNGKNSLKAIDFFCGAGGMTKGMMEAGVKIIAGIDIDPACKQTYEENNSPSKFIEGDVVELTPERLAKITGIERNDNTLIFIGCSPCQYWTKIPTIKNKNQHTKDLLSGFIKFIAWFRPGFIVVENVPGLYKQRDNNVLDSFLSFLEQEGYQINHSKIVKALRYGVPQNRERYVLLANRMGFDIIIPEVERTDNLTVRQFIGTHNGFAKIESGHRDTTSFMHTASNLSEDNKRRIMMTDLDGGTRYCWKDDNNLQIPTYKGRDRMFRNVYGRMFWDKPAPTITTRFHSLSNGRFGHPEENRALSLREGATLQTFPKEYHFIGSIPRVARQIGNAVPPELARRIGLGIKQSWENAILSS